MKPTDAVARECIANTTGCNLINKCEDCKKEIKNLVEIDDMFVDYFKQLEYIKNKVATDKKNETT